MEDATARRVHRKAATADAPIDIGEAQRARQVRLAAAPRQGGVTARAAVAIFDTSVPVYMQTVRETSICPELIPAPEPLVPEVLGRNEEDDH